jgi:TRAP-type mannitol/chloroaromatic compound transport system permease small subunit
LELIGDVMSYLRLILKGIDGLNKWIARIISWAVVLLIITTVYEVIMRYVFNSPTNWVFEFNYLLNGPYFMILGAYTLAVNGHVNVDIFTGRLSPRMQAILSILTMPIFFFFIIMLLIFGGKFALISLQSRETLSSAWGPPVYPVKLAIPFAAFLMLLQGTAKFIRDIHQAFTGREGEL